MRDTIAKASLHMTAPDWQSVQDIVSNASIPTTSSFDLFISKRKGDDFRIQMGIPPEIKSREEEKVEHIPIKKIPVGLYDLYW